MRLCQLAMSVADDVRTRTWYRQVLGCEKSGGHDAFDGRQIADTQRLPEPAELSMSWLVDSQDFFQLELFRYRAPVMREQRADQRRSDHGYRAFGVYVTDFARTTRTLEDLEAVVLAEAAGNAGRRRLVVADPNGIPVEIMEDDPRSPDVGRRLERCCGSAVRSVTVSVPALDDALDLHRRLGARPARDGLRFADQDSSWLAGSQIARSALLWSGDVLLELVEFTDARPWPDAHLISDQGIQNVAVGTEDLAHFEAVVDDLDAAGYELRPGAARDDVRLCYAWDRHGFNVELVYWAAGVRHRYGFTPLARDS